MRETSPDACWPAAMMILISNFCALLHGEEEEVGREMRALSLSLSGRSLDLIIWKRYLLVGAAGVYLDLESWDDGSTCGDREERGKTRKRPLLVAVVLKDFNLAR